MNQNSPLGMPNSIRFFRYTARYCSGAGRTAIAVDVNQPISFVNSLIEIVDFLKETHTDVKSGLPSLVEEL